MDSHIPLRRRLYAACLVTCGLVAAAACGSGTTTTPGFQPIGVGAGPSAGGNGGVGGATSAVASTSGTGGQAPEGLGPPYPIVLAHGFFGFEEFAGLDFITYYYEVQEHLADRGEVYVFTPAVDPFNDSTTRGAQLADAVEDILQATGYAKVNLIGHSQGGLDARVVAHDHPEWVASVVTLQTPHFGTPISDIALEIVSDPNLQAILDWIIQALGSALYEEVDGNTSISDGMIQFSSPAIAQFNMDYPDQPGIFYASVAGRSDYHGGGDDCDAPNAPPFIAEWASETDPIDPLFSVTEAVLDGGFGDPYPNDGLVRVQDARWGMFLGCVPADHMDMVGQLFGDSPGGSNDWDYKQFYVDLVQYLRSRGL